LGNNIAINKKGKENMAVIKMNFLSKFLGMQTNITVCLPTLTHPDVVNNNLDFYKRGMKFQTLYLLHGGAGDDSDYVHLTSIVRYADENRIAVVMPCAYNYFYTDDRKGPRYWKYVSEELIEVCQTLFPLSDQPEDNFVAGLSMGGSGAMKMGLVHPERFAAVLCMSGSSINPQKIKDFPGPRARLVLADPDVMPRIPLDVIFGDLDQYEGSVHDMWQQARLNVEQGKKLPRFFLTVGDKDFAREHVEEAYEYLTSLGYDTFFELVPGYGHEWSFWDLSLKKALDDWLPLRRSPMY
jgi:S-formylglutathione hydrolase FrmB